MNDTSNDLLYENLSMYCDKIVKLFKGTPEVTVIITNDEFGDAGVIFGNGSVTRIFQEFQKRFPEKNIKYEVTE